MKIYQISKFTEYFVTSKESDIVPMGWTDVTPTSEVLRFKWMKFINGTWVGTETDPNLFAGDVNLCQRAITNYKKRVYEILENEGELIKNYYRSLIDVGTPDANYILWTEYWKLIITLDNDPGFDPLNISWPTPPSF